jgi:hypothetical protein
MKTKIRKTRNRTRNKTRNKTRRIGGSYYSAQGSDSYYTAAPGSIGSQYNLPQNKLNRERRMWGKRNSVQQLTRGRENTKPEPLTYNENRAWRNFNGYARDETRWNPSQI